ncbi:MAG: VWA domain-containing protein [Rhodothermales bacterium]|nr:VWA domain-containing protein [Rhodothermales bacterium]
MSQTYLNDEQVNIEAVYTFPLPLDAVLLDLQVEIGEQVLKGVVVEKNAAEEQYEDAVESGDSAVMLQEIEPGLYTMNVGNLLAQEKATITFSYAILYSWTGDRLRFLFPTTVAPRFGMSPHHPHQVPESSLSVENQFSLKVEIFGLLRQAQFVCPSHDVELAKTADKIVISLRQDQAVMDRDLILNVKSPHSTRNFALCGSDGDGVAAVVSFQPFFPGLKQPKPLNLAIVIDCSGSMQGDSIEQAKQALTGILEALQPHDRVTLVAFGSTTEVLSKRLLNCNKTNLAKARRFAKQLDANMGGTAIGSALDEAYSVLHATESADIFLVTDGEVSSWKPVVQEAKRSGHRIFTVGVGSAVSEAFLRTLAADTGGNCELVSPREGMADRIVRHFERMRAPRASRVAIHWPDGAKGIAPLTPGAVFEGDTVIAYARFDHPTTSGSVILEVETEKGDVNRQELPLSMPPLPETTGHISTVARLAASARMTESDAQQGLETALSYQLVSPWTNWLVIAERAEDEKARDLPELRKVPQTLAAGWGGVGTTKNLMMHIAPDSAPVFSCHTADSFDIDEKVLCGDIEPRGISRPDIPEPFHTLLTMIEDDPTGLNPRKAFALLQETDVGAEFGDLFQHAQHLGLNVEMIALIALAELLSGPLKAYLSVETRSAIGSLQAHAQQAKKAILEVGRHGNTLARIMSSSVGSEVFRQDHAQDVKERLERLEGISNLLAHLQDCTRRCAELLKM